MDTKEFKAQVQRIKALEAEVESLKLQLDTCMLDHSRAEDRLSTRIAKLRHILHSVIETI